MKIVKAISLILGEYKNPIISDYDLSIILWRLYKERIYKENRLSIRTENLLSREIYSKRVNELIDYGIIESFPGLPAKRYFSVLGKKDFDDLDLICCVDPFSFISHLSAMSFHGLTDRIPSFATATRPTNRNWTLLATKKMFSDLDDDLDSYRDSGLPAIRRTHATKIKKTQVAFHQSKDYSGYINISGRPLRVASIGRTFLDMLRSPEHCGGMRHVVNVYTEYAGTYKKLIISEVESHAKPLEKIRAGYLLSEVLGIKSDTIESWKRFRQRGGSQKLDPKGDFLPTFSDEWWISINV